jgi:ABC-2 type transport system permease protein
VELEVEAERVLGLGHHRCRIPTRTHASEGTSPPSACMDDRPAIPAGRSHARRQPRPGSTWPSAANPSRRLVLLAKAAAVTTVALVAGVLGVLGSLVAGRAILPDNGFTSAKGNEPLSLADGSTLRAAVGTVLYLALVALLSLGIATAVRGTAGAITGVLTLLCAFPIIAQLVSDPRWQQRPERYGPMEAGLSVQHTMRLDELAIGPWPGLGVLATYAGFALLSGLTLFQLRDA